MKVRIATVLVLLLFVNLYGAPVAAVTYSVAEEWTKTATGDVLALSVSADGAHLAAGTIDGKVYYFTSEGLEVWNVTISSFTSDQVNLTEVTTGGVFAAVNRSVYLLGLTDGSTTWSRTNTTDNELIIGLAAAADGSVVTAISDNYVYMYSSTGSLVGRYGTIGAGNYWKAVEVTSDGSVVIAANGTGLTNFRSSTLTPDYTPATGYSNIFIHNIIGGSSRNETSYPVHFNISNLSCTTTGNTLCLGPGVTLPTWNDLRFSVPVAIGSGSGPTTFLPHWIEAANESEITVWVKMPVVANSSSVTNVTLRMDYNNPGAVNSEAPHSVFLLFDHFDSPAVNTSNWYWWNATGPGGTWAFEISSSLLHLGSNAPGSIDGPWLNSNNITKGFYYDNTSVRFRAMTDTYFLIGENNAPPSTADPRTSNDAAHLDWQTFSYIEVATGGAGAASSNTAKVLNAYNTFDVKRIPYNVSAFVNDTWFTRAIPSYSGASAPEGVGLMGKMGPAGNNAQLYLDWIAIRNATYPEPANDFWTEGSQAPGPAYYLGNNSRLIGTGARSIALDSTDKHLSVSNTSYHSDIGFTATTGAYGTIYSYASSSGLPTAPVKVSDAGAFAIEGRGSGIVDIIRLDGTRVGTYTTGGTVSSVAISKNGLWAAAASDDGTVYIFSKASSSSWTLLFQSDTTSQVKSVDLYAGSTKVYGGRGDGSVTAYSVGESATGSTTFWVSKGGIPYTGQSMTVRDCGTSGASCSSLYSGSTDSYGSYSAALTFGHYYEISVNAGEKNVTVLSNSNLLTYYIAISMGLPATVDYSAFYDGTSPTHDIWLWFQNASTGDSATWTITRLVDNVQVVSYTCSSATLPTYMNYSVPDDWLNSSYLIRATVSSGGHAASGTWVITAVNTSTGEGGAGNFLPPAMNSYIKLAVAFILALLIGGVFSYISGPLGAFITACSWGGMILLHLVPTSFATTAALLVVWAFLGFIGRSSPEV